MIIFGHRGAKGEAAENTIAGAKKMLASGVTAIEFDIRLSSDGVLMVFHDADLTRLCDQALYIHQTTAEDLQKYQVKFNNQLNGGNTRKHTIPTLADFLAALPELTTIQFEIKSDQYTDIGATVAALADFFNQAEQVKRSSNCDFIVTSFDSRMLAKLRQNSISSTLNFGLLCYDDIDAGIDKAITIGCEYFCPQEKLIVDAKTSSLSRLKKAKADGTIHHVSCWTCNNPDLVAELTESGVDSIMTDFPSLFV